VKEQNIGERTKGVLLVNNLPHSALEPLRCRFKIPTQPSKCGGIAAVCLWLVVAGFLIGCNKPAPSPNASATNHPPLNSPLTALVGAFRDVYQGTAAGPPETQYRVEVTLLNTSTNRVVFEAVEGRFYSDKGPPLKSVTTGKDGGLIVVNPKMLERFTFPTDGYTADLLRRAEGGPLHFGVAVRWKRTSDLWLWVAPLPPLLDLPLYPAGGPSNSPPPPLKLRPAHPSQDGKLKV